jgi:hypothetical protein
VPGSRPATRERDLPGPAAAARDRACPDCPVPDPGDPPDPSRLADGSGGEPPLPPVREDEGDPIVRGSGPMFPDGVRCTKKNAVTC